MKTTWLDQHTLDLQLWILGVVRFAEAVLIVPVLVGVLASKGLFETHTDDHLVLTLITARV